jgi:hypothetical protein
MYRMSMGFPHIKAMNMGHVNLALFCINLQVNIEFLNKIKNDHECSTDETLSQSEIHMNNIKVHTQGTGIRKPLYHY